MKDVPTIVKTLRNNFAKFIHLDEVSQALAVADLLPKGDIGMCVCMCGVRVPHVRRTLCMTRTCLLLVRRSCVFAHL